MKKSISENEFNETNSNSVCLVYWCAANITDVVLQSILIFPTDYIN